MTTTSIESLLPTAMLEEFRARAHEYDSANRFFTEDFAALQNSGYLAASVPAEWGGAGLKLSELILAQRRLASFAPATALGVNMHLVWTQVAKFLRDRAIAGGPSEAQSQPMKPDHRESTVSAEPAEMAGGPLDWILHEAVSGEVFAFGISEAGNDAVLMDAFSQATPDDEGYLVSGTKIFTTLSPVWTRLGVHARCENVSADGAADPYIVFGFVRREKAGDVQDLGGGSISHPGTWNPLGMRATQSWNTRLEDVRIAQADIAAKIEPLVGQHPLVLGIFSAFSLLTAAVYAGIADRALELAQTAALSKAPTLDNDTAIALDDPDTASRLTRALLDHRASLDSLEVLARDIDALRMREDWPLALAACRNRVTDEARDAVDVAMRLMGSRGFQADSELARLYRDVLAGMFHPSSSASLARTIRSSLIA